MEDSLEKKVMVNNVPNRRQFVESLKNELAVYFDNSLSVIYDSNRGGDDIDILMGSAHYKIVERVPTWVFGLFKFHTNREIVRVDDEPFSESIRVRDSRLSDIVKSYVLKNAEKYKLNDAIHITPAK